MKEFFLYNVIFPPMPIIWCMILILIFNSKFRANRTFKTLFIILTFISVPMLVKIIIFPLTIGAGTYKDEDKISLVLVPTAGSFMTFTKDWYPSSETIKRAIKGNALAKKINVPLIISGGSNDISTPPESILVSNLIENNTNIFLELKSRNTFETSRNLKAFLMKNNIKSDHYILLVTSSIHNLRTILTLKSFGYNVKIQNEYDYLSMSIWDIFPDARSLGFWNAALYEYMGIIKYIINGNINLKALRL